MVSTEVCNYYWSTELRSILWKCLQQMRLQFQYPPTGGGCQDSKQDSDPYALSLSELGIV